MPIWMELIFLLLGVYTLGLGIGWLIWGRGEIPAPIEIESDDAESSESDEL